MKVEIGNGEFHVGDCFDVMGELPDASVDMILCDLPYGTTQNKWDSVLPLHELWREYWRVCRGVVVLTAVQPFTTTLGSSQTDCLRYSLVWDKVRPVGHLMAKRRPMQRHEDILVFSQSTPPYFPQGLLPHGKVNRRTTSGTNYNKAGTENVAEFTGYPQSILEFGSEQRGKIHPTQKPVALFEYLIRTYTNPGEAVLDNTAGSGTTAVAAENADRRWICIERDEDYAAKAMERIRQHVIETPAPAVRTPKRRSAPRDVGDHQARFC
jgi:site-specific DNA-methyltransferase (adenine-specific)